MKDSRGLLAVVSAIVAIGLALIWVSSTREAAVEPMAVGRAASSGALRETSAALVPQVRASSPSLPVLQAQGHSNQVFVCGLGWVDRLEDGSLKEGTAEGKAAVELARRRLIDRLAGDANALARATAMLLDDQAGTLLPSPVELPSSEAAMATWQQRRGQTAERLAQVAVSATDPRLYGLAIRACKSDPTIAASGNCASLSVQQWARLDPDDAGSWLYALAEGSARNDQPAIAEALFHIGSAAHWKGGMFQPMAEIDRLTGPTDVDIAAALEVAIEVIGVAAAQSEPMLPLIRACRMPAVADANRHQLCDRVAETMTQRSDSLMAGMIGSSIGRNLGWSPDRIDAIRGLADATIDSLPSQDSSDCATAKSVLRRLAHQAQVGEVGYAREWMAASGRSIDTYARKERDRRLLREAADAAASAAQASSPHPGINRTDPLASSPYSATPPPAR